MYLVYILKSDNRSYIGMTNDFFKRWKQHNKIIKGGAKYTSKYDNWSPICIVDGFKTKSEAMQCEWKLKRVKGYYNRICNLSKILQNDQFRNLSLKRQKIFLDENVANQGSASINLIKFLDNLQNN